MGRTAERTTTFLGQIRVAHERLADAQKSRRGQAYSVLVNRPLGRWLAAAAHAVGLAPNQVTVASALCSVAGIALLATGSATPLTGVAVSTLLLAAYALDSADGQLARLHGGGSPAGEFLDHLVDAGKIPALHLAVATVLYRTDAVDAWILLIPLGYAVVDVVTFASMLLRDLLGRVARRKTAAPPAQSIGALLVRLPLDYGVLCLSFLVLGWVDLFALVYGGLFAANLVSVLLIARRWFREVAAFENPQSR